MQRPGGERVLRRSDSQADSGGDAHAEPAQETKQGEEVPGSYVYAKLAFPEISVVAFGKDEKGEDYEIKFMSKPTNNFNQFYKIR